MGDNDVVTSNLLQGGASIGVGDLGVVTGRFWHSVVLESVSLCMHRGLAHCSIANEPSQDDVKLLRAHIGLYKTSRLGTQKNPD